MNKKLKIGVDKLLIDKDNKNVIGVYVGNMTINNKDKEYLKDNELIFISPNLYKLSYYEVWIKGERA